MSNAADNLGQNIGKLYRESTSIGADVGGLYSEAISIDNNPIQPGGGGSDNPFVAGLQTLPRNGQSSQFPFEIIVNRNSQGNIDVTVLGSYVYDFSGSFTTPVLNEVDTLQTEITQSGINYVYLTITVSLVSGDNKSVSTAVLSIDTSPPTIQPSEIVIEIAEIDVTSSNGRLSASLKHNTTGAIFYPPIPGYSDYTLGSGYLQIGLGNTETQTATLPSEITGYILNVKDYFNLKVGDSGSEIIDIDSTSVITGRTLGIREIINEAGTTSGNLIATQDLTQGVGWANYSSGDLEIGGSNTDGVADLDIDFSGVLTMTGGTDFSFIASTTAEDSTLRMGSARVNQADVGDFVSGNPAGIYCAVNSTGISTTDSAGNPLITIDSSDLPATVTLPAKFREVKVCNNGVPATAYILMTDPVND